MPVNRDPFALAPAAPTAVSYGHAAEEETVEATPATRLAAVLRLVLGGVFLWAFLDKLLGLGYATARDAAWVRGGSPTNGFLTFGTKGPLEGFYTSIAGNAAVDALFMAGLLAVGLALLSGIALRVAGAAGALMVLLMWSADLPPENNPVLDDHVVYAVALLLLPALRAGDVYGLGRPWRRLSLVRAHRWLE